MRTRRAGRSVGDRNERERSGMSAHPPRQDFPRACLGRSLRAATGSGLSDTDRMNWLCDKSKVYAICIQTQPHGETIHGELRAAIDAEMLPNKKGQQ